MDDVDEIDAERADQSEVHGETFFGGLVRRPLPAERCPEHGLYRPTSIIDRDCPNCRPDTVHQHRTGYLERNN